MLTLYLKFLIYVVYFSRFISLEMTNLCRLLLRQYLTIEVCGIPNTLNRVDSTIFKIICRRRQTARRLETRRRQHRRLDIHVLHLFGLQSKTKVNA